MSRTCVPVFRAGSLHSGLLAFGPFLPAPDLRAQGIPAPAVPSTLQRQATRPPADIMAGNRMIATLRGVFFKDPTRKRAGVSYERIEATETRRETTQPTRRIVTVVFWISALAMACPHLPGSGSEAVEGVGVIVGLMVSIGSSALIGQLASGPMIMYSRTLRVGGYVTAGDIEGTVVPFGLFSMRIRTVRKEILTIPNAVLPEQITSPNYEVEPEVAKVLPREQWHAAPARRCPDEGRRRG